MNKNFLKVVRLLICCGVAGGFIFACTGCQTVYPELSAIPDYPENTRSYKTDSTIEYLQCDIPVLDKNILEQFARHGYKGITNSTYYKDSVPASVLIFRVLEFTQSRHKRPDGIYLDSRLIVMVREPGALLHGALLYKKPRYFQARSRIHAPQNKLTANDYQQGRINAVEHLFRIHEFRQALEGSPAVRNAPAVDMKNKESLWRRSVYYQTLDAAQKFEAIRWAYYAAMAGHRAAQKYIAVQALDSDMAGDGKRQYKLAEFLAKTGLAEAQFLLGSMYSYGAGTPENIQEGIRFITLAANQNYARAQFTLGVFYSIGRGVPKDLKKAVSYLQAAKYNGYAPAESYLPIVLKMMAKTK